jgi:hypothetical protein
VKKHEVDPVLRAPVNGSLRKIPSQTLPPMIGMSVNVQDIAAMLGKTDHVRRPFDQPETQAGYRLPVRNANPCQVFVGRHFLL